MGKNKNRNKNKSVTTEGEIQNDVDPKENDGNNNISKDKNNCNDGGGEGKKDDGVIKVVLKVGMHCQGCEAKIKKNLRSFKGFESLKWSNDGSNKLTVIGDVDPVKLREMLEKKTKKKVDLISPQPKKDKDAGDKKKDGENKPEKLSEIPVTTALMKLNLHCEGCIRKLRKAVAKTKGYHDMTIDEQKNQMTVKGAMDMKALAESLKVKLKKPVEIIPPKKDKDKDKDGGEKNGGEKKEKGGGSEKGGGKVDEIRAQHEKNEYPDYPVGLLHTPDIFSDENVNACSVM